MQTPFELLIGWRYTRASRRKGFISFISTVAVLGITLGVAALIVVLSVMNGFQKEVRDRMLGVLSHIEVVDTGGRPIFDLQDTLALIESHPAVVGAAPFVAEQALVARDQQMKGVVLRGIDPALEPKVSDLAAGLASTVLPRLVPGESGIVLGRELAGSLGVVAGDKVTLLTANGQAALKNVTPRMHVMTVVGTFESGHFQYDSVLALMHEADLMRIFGLTGPTGIRVKIRDLHAAPAVAMSLANQLPFNLAVRDWTRQNRNWFAAVQHQKRIMFIVLTLVVAVAAFNLVSTLVMTVTDKQGDIAILRTLGASPLSIMKIFVVQGVTVGVIGTGLGLLLGLGIAFNVGALVAGLETVLGTRFLAQEIYFISSIPSDPQQHDVLLVAAISLILSVVVAIYPSWRASRVQPAEALRYE